MEGRIQEANRSLSQLERSRASHSIDGGFAVRACMALGDEDCALRWVKRAYEERSSVAVYFPLYFKDDLPHMPRVRTLLAEMRGHNTKSPQPATPLPPSLNKE